AACAPSPARVLVALPLRDALPIYRIISKRSDLAKVPFDARSDKKAIQRNMKVTVRAVVLKLTEPEHSIARAQTRSPLTSTQRVRSEEHTSELQSRENLVCRLLLEK